MFASEINKGAKDPPKRKKRWKGTEKKKKQVREYETKFWWAVGGEMEVCLCVRSWRTGNIDDGRCGLVSTHIFFFFGLKGAARLFHLPYTRHDCVCPVCVCFETYNGGKYF